jgi:hypothetical protein
MSVTKYTIIESWPALKEDLESFLPGTEDWVIGERGARGRERADKLIRHYGINS